MKDKVAEIMTKDVVTVKENDALLSVAEIFQKRKIAGAPVLNEKGHLVGVISEADILKLLDSFHWHNPLFTAIDLLHLHEEELDPIQQDIQRASETKVKHVMSRNAVTIKSDQPIGDAAQIMSSTGFNRLPVVDENGKLLGIVARADIIGSLYE